jgi:hypothetical protein
LLQFKTRGNIVEEFIGTKRVTGKPMTRQEYNDYRGWALPADECGGDEGYLVEYLDGGIPNHGSHKGYISWSPEEQFEGSYCNTLIGMTFGHAVEMAKAGRKVARHGWNGKGMWVIYNPGSEGKTHSMFDGSVYKTHGVDECEILPHFDMYTVNSEGRRAMLVGMPFSSSDIVATDWVVVD